LWKESPNCEVWGSQSGDVAGSLMWMQVETDDAGSDMWVYVRRDVDTGSTEMLMQVQQRW
jgi:hypothetical protein